MTINMKKVVAGLMVVVGSLLCCFGTLRFIPTVMSIGHVNQGLIEKDLMLSVACWGCFFCC